jgi:hypothetical protein
MFSSVIFCNSARHLRLPSSALTPKKAFPVPRFYWTEQALVNFYQTTRRNDSQDSHLQTRRLENQKSHRSLSPPPPPPPTGVRISQPSCSLSPNPPPFLYNPHTSQFYHLLKMKVSGPSETLVTTCIITRKTILHCREKLGYCTISHYFKKNAEAEV